MSSIVNKVVYLYVSVQNNPMKRFFILLILWSFACATAHAEALQFTHLTTNEGLSQNTVFDIIQDSKGFMWFATKEGLNRYDGQTFKIFKHRPFSDQGLKNSSIRCMVEDRANRIWVGTESGVCRYDPETERFTDIILRNEAGEAIHKPIVILERDAHGNIWLVTETKEIFRYDPESDDIECCYRASNSIQVLRSDPRGRIWFYELGCGLFSTDDHFQNIERFEVSNPSEIDLHHGLSYLCFDEYSRMYVGFESEGVAEVNLVDRRATRLPLVEGRGKPLYVRHIMVYNAEELWIGSESGLFIFNLHTRTAQRIQHSLYDPYSLSDNAVYTTFKDNEEGIWVGTFFGGVNYLPLRKAEFTKYYPTNDPQSIKGLRIRELCPDSQGCLWVGSEDAGLYHFDPRQQSFRYVEASRHFSNVHGLLMHGHELWISTFSKGIHVLDTRTGRIRVYDVTTTDGRLFSNYVFALCKSRDGHIYIGTMHGLQFYNLYSGEFGYVPEINDGKMVNDIQEDSAGNLWVATLTNGLYVRTPYSDTWRHYLHDADNLQSLPCNNVTSVFEDSDRRIWITTEGGGFSVFEAGEGYFTHYNTGNGLASDVAFQIVEDDNGMFWISTNNGLVAFDPAERKTKYLYTVANSLPSNQFNYKSSYKAEDGTLYFGCIEGLISFNPQRLNRQQNKLPPVYITDFSLLDFPDDGSASTLCDKSIIACDTLYLRHNQNSFSLQLSVLSYRKSPDTHLSYRMEGYDDQWRETPADGAKLPYTKLPPGRYTFHVRLDNGAQSTRKSLHIHITPPLYRSQVASILYFALILGMLYWLYKHNERRRIRREEEHRRDFEQQKNSELYDVKIKFFTNIAHEIRTPLTLIKVPLDSILSHKELNSDLYDTLHIMSQNTNRLLDLTNQLLDFRKIEKEHLTLSLAMYDVARIVRETFYRFSSMAREQGKKFELTQQNGDRAVWAKVDREAFTKIVSNLLVNALKFSDSRILISTETVNDSFILRVVNDGEVVPPKVRSDIFAPFFQHAVASTFPGTGIGLTLSNSLAMLQNGTLRMGDSLTENEFILTLPLAEQSLAEEQQKEDYNTTEPVAREKTDSEEHATLLIVEDHPDMRNYIAQMLCERYIVRTAANGAEALEVVKTEHVDIVLSDIIMPRMDGLELCRHMKNEVRSSHIPFILLTAKTDIQSKIQSMDLGADCYIEKPFSSEYLQSAISNLLKSRRMLFDRFLKNPLIMANSVSTSSTDRVFIQKLQDIVRNNFNNPEFNTCDLAKLMYMSRASFYRKVKGLMDIAPNDYIQLERLKTAAQILKKGEYQINEVCYMVGFSSPSYFTKCFQKQYGITPKQFMLQIKNKSTREDREDLIADETETDMKN